MVLLLVLSGAFAGNWDCEDTDMIYMNHYDSPLGGITVSSNGREITGLWFDG